MDKPEFWKMTKVKSKLEKLHIFSDKMISATGTNFAILKVFTETGTGMTKIEEVGWTLQKAARE